MEVFHRQSVSHITTVAVYEDMSVKQVCFDPNTREVQIYRASPDVEDGCRFMRATKFAFDFKDLGNVIACMPMLKDKEEPLIEIAVKQTKRLVFLLNEQFGNWEMGYQKKKAVQKRKAVLVDLVNEDLDDQPVRSNLRVEVLKPDYEEELNRFENVKFKKNEDFESVVDRLIEFQKDVLDSYPHLRSDKIFVEAEDAIDERYFKRHVELFKYFTFQLNFDKEDRSMSRISLIRQYSNDLKAVDETFDGDFVKNEKKVHELCRILRATHSAARGAARDQQASSSRGSSSTVTSAGGVYNRGPPSKKKN